MLHSPTSGDASVCGYDVLEQSIEVRKKVGYLPENNPFTSISMSGIPRFYRRNAPAEGNIAGRVAEMIEITGLQSEQHKKIGALSKGYRQRVALPRPSSMTRGAYP